MHPVAGPTMSSALGPPGISYVVWMPLGAVGLDAPMLPAFSAPNILLMGDRFQMVSVDTIGNAAQMIKFEDFGEGAYE